MSTCCPARCPGQPGTSNTSVRAVAVSSCAATSRAACHSGIAFLFPRVADVVIAVLLPEPEFVVRHQREAVDPLRALPEVEVRDEHPRGPTVLGGKVFAVELERYPRLPAEQIGGAHVRRVSAVARGHRVLRARVHALEQVVE